MVPSDTLGADGLFFSEMGHPRDAIPHLDELRLAAERRGVDHDAFAVMAKPDRLKLRIRGLKCGN